MKELVLTPDWPMVYDHPVLSCDPVIVVTLLAFWLHGIARGDKDV